MKASLQLYSRIQPCRRSRGFRFYSQESKSYDLCIIGGGPAGFAAAARATDFGKKVCIVEKNRLGGAGLHDGALSSKTLWELSNEFRRLQKPKRGFSAREITFRYSDVCAAVEEVQASKESQILQSIRQLNIDLYHGAGSFINNREVEVRYNDDSRLERINASHFLIATGSSPRKHKDIAADGEIILTSDHMHRLPRLPKSIVIVGAGVVGCEYATILSNFGCTEVHVIDKAARILPSEDPDVADAVASNFESKGVIIHHGATLESLKVVNGQVEYVIKTGQTGKLESFRVEKALLSIGRTPNLSGIGLENTTCSRKDGMLVTSDCQTSVPHIWAAGDATIDIALVNIAEYEARHAVERIWDPAPKLQSYDNISTIMFLDPSVAACGMNETILQKRKIPYKVARFAYPLVSRAIAKRSTDGFVKLMVSLDDNPKVLGIRALGTHASSIVDICSMMIKSKIPAKELLDLMIAYPAMTEGLQECARVLFSQSIHKSTVFPQWIWTKTVRYDSQGQPVLEDN